MIGKKADSNCIRECLWGFARWLPVKQNNSALVYNTVDHALGRKGERKKQCTSKTEAWKLQPNHLSFSSLCKQSTSAWSIQQLKRNEFWCNIVLRKTKGYWSDSSHCKADFGLLAAVCECMLVRTKKQQRDTASTENTEWLFIRGPNMKESSGCCHQSWTEAATTQLSVLRRRVAQRHRRLGRRERRMEERFPSREPCGEIKPEDSEHSLTDALEKHSLHWWTGAFYAVLRGQR